MLVETGVVPTNADVDNIAVGDRRDLSNCPVILLYVRTLGYYFDPLPNVESP